MKKLITIALFYLFTFNVGATSVFYGSLYMLDNNGNTVSNPQCLTCDASMGEIDNNLSTLVDLNSFTSNDLIGNHDFLDVGLDWSLSDLSFSINNDATISVSGDFLWTNYNGLTTSSFSQLSQPLGAYGEIFAIDGDSDMIKGNALIDGPFAGYTLYLEGQLTTIPVPGAVWLMISGVLGLFAFARRKG